MQGKKMQPPPSPGTRVKRESRKPIGGSGRTSKFEAPKIRLGINGTATIVMGELDQIFMVKTFAPSCHTVSPMRIRIKGKGSDIAMAPQFRFSKELNHNLSQNLFLSQPPRVLTRSPGHLATSLERNCCLLGVWGSVKCKGHKGRKRKCIGCISGPTNHVR